MHKVSGRYRQMFDVVLHTQADVSSLSIEASAKAGHTDRSEAGLQAADKQQVPRGGGVCVGGGSDPHQRAQP